MGRAAHPGPGDRYHESTVEPGAVGQPLTPLGGFHGSRKLGRSGVLAPPGGWCTAARDRHLTKPGVLIWDERLRFDPVIPERGAPPASPEPMNTHPRKRGQETVFVASGPGPR